MDAMPVPCGCQWLNRAIFRSGSLGQMFPSLHPAAHPLPPQPNPPTSHLLLKQRKVLLCVWTSSFTITFFTLRSITLDYITFQLARHSSRRRGGGARIDPLPLSRAATLPPCPSIPRELSFPVQGMAFGYIFPGLEVGHFQCQKIGLVYLELTSLLLALAETLSLRAA